MKMQRDAAKMQMDAANRRYARMLQRMWVSFAKTGNPSIPGVEWPAFDDRTRKVMILAEEGPRVEANPEAERTELELRLLKNPNYKFVKGLAPVHERIIARDGAERFEAVMRKQAELAEETRGTSERFTREELAYMSATVQIELFKAGYISPTDVLEAQISRVKEFNGEYNTARRDLLNELETFNAGKVNAITFDNFAEARKLAKEAGRRYRDGTARRLEGVTVGVKDDCDVRGWRTDSGSLINKDEPAAETDDEFIARLRAEGAIFVFQTTVPEFCSSSMTWSRLYGVTRNPWNLPYGVGGSSGGSGASLAAGFCTLATGSDMGGSIRIPASMNGVYGFKPPFGRIPISTESPFMGYGPLARTFADMVLMQDVMTGPADGVHCALRPKLDYPTEYAPITGVKVAVAYMEDWLPGGCDADVVKARFRGAVEGCAAELPRRSLPGLPEPEVSRPNRRAGARRFFAIIGMF